MIAGSELQRDPSSQSADFCVVATKLLIRVPPLQKSTRPPADQVVAGTPFPDVHHRFHPPPTALLQNPDQSLGQSKESDLVATNTWAPTTEHAQHLPITGSRHRSNCCGGAALNSHGRAAFASPREDYKLGTFFCGKPVEMFPAALSARRGEDMERRTRSVLQGSPPKLHIDTSDATSLATVRAQGTSLL